MSRGVDTSNMITLKVDNISFRATAEDVRDAFAKFGEIGDVYIPRERATGQMRGFAFVRFMDKRDAEDALHRMDGQDLDGRVLRIQFAMERRPRGDDSRSGGGGGYDRGGDRDRGYGRSSGGGYRSSRRSRSRSRSPPRRERRRSPSRSPPPRRSSRDRSRDRSPPPARRRSRSRSRSP
ncbi:hypothetical protein JKP88DRAFT_216645 [Tribonema minus]|uniref:RRM domain-containing protein n=1 Tax=Tribonema minus TaxID=303371 RepID=A0A835YJN0_9STRA|nr:hypothetical protein JKP88DRAFT_216645 [Tribonema minus]